MLHPRRSVGVGGVYTATRWWPYDYEYKRDRGHLAQVRAKGQKGFSEDEYESDECDDWSGEYYETDENDESESEESDNNDVEMLFL